MRFRLLNWPFQETSTLSVQGWGFWLAILGMIVSIVGFWITIVQLVRTKKATAAVSEEVKRIGFAVSKYDATVETSRAETALQAARKFVKTDDWGQAGESLEMLAKALHTIRELAIPELAVHVTSIDNVMGHANRLCERLDRSGSTGLSDADKQKTLSSMREHDRTITSMRIALQRSNIGE